MRFPRLFHRCFPGSSRDIAGERIVCCHECGRVLIRKTLT